MDLIIENKKETGVEIKSVMTTQKQLVTIPAGVTVTIHVNNISSVTVEVDELNGLSTYMITKSNNVSTKLILYREGGNGGRIKFG
jgi:hypothetical protein